MFRDDIMSQKTLFKCPYCNKEYDDLFEAIKHLKYEHNMSGHEAFDYIKNVRTLETFEDEKKEQENTSTEEEEEEWRHCMTVFSGKLCEGDNVMVFLTHVKTPIRGVVESMDRSGITIRTGVSRDMISFKGIRHIRVIGDDE
ncbi:hypothetical protein J7L13_00200 [bacterium]|nr:hypothetical protein [bacterium]